jgi:MerR family transcriptional regulator, repressor of the yfmOP operon
MTEPERTYRTGEAADLLGVTPRTIRYYQELGLVHAGSGRDKGEHRVFTDGDLARLSDLIRLRDLLGLSLEELTALAEAEEARAALRDEWANTRDDGERRQILERAIPHIRRQLELVLARRQTFDEVAAQLAARLEELEQGLAKLQ